MENSVHKHLLPLANSDSEFVPDQEANPKKWRSERDTEHILLSSAEEDTFSM